MGMTPTHVPSARRLAVRSSTAVIPISTTHSRKITVASNSGPTHAWIRQCVLSSTLLSCLRGSAPVLPGPDHHETKGFPGPTMRSVPSTIGSFEGPSAGGLTHTHAGAGVSSNTMLAPAFSVLTHPPLSLRNLGQKKVRIGVIYDRIRKIRHGLLQRCQVILPS